MSDIINYIDVIQKIGFVGLLIILAFPVLRKKFLGNGNGKELKEIKDNHLHNIEKKLDILINQNEKILWNVEEMRKK